jgi:hypothetical protein
MDKPEETKEPSAAAGTSGAAGPVGAPPPAGESSVTEPKIDPKIESAGIEAPSIVPSAIDMTGIAAAIAEVSKLAGKPEAIEPPVSKVAAAAPHEVIPVAAPATRRASRLFGKFTPLAAALLLAAAFGAIGGALGATGLERLAALFSGTPATAEGEPSVPAAVAQLRTEIAALRTSLDATSRNTSTQFARLSERFDRIERAQTASAKADMSSAKETTGSMTPPTVAGAPLPPAAVPQSANVSGWVLRDVYRGAALLQSRMGGLIEVEPGDILPGVGRIEAIRRQDGHWVVVTAKGMITSMR